MKTTPVPNVGTLPNWLADVRRRGCNITVTDGVIHVRGVAANDTDRHHVNRYRHALTVAADGTHPDWWTTVLRRATPHPDLDLPGTYHDPACATCGDPASHLGPDLLAWCDRHHQPEVSA